MEVQEPLETLQNYLQDHRNEMTKKYEAAIKEVYTRLAILKDDFRLLKKRDCISTIQTRIKADTSILEKLTRKGMPMDLISILDKYYLEVCSKLADIELMDNTMDDIFAYYKELAGVLVNKSMLGVKMREAYRKKDKAELELLRDTMEECAKKMWNLKELRKSIWFRECKPFGYEVLDIRYGGVYVRLMSSIQRIDAFLKGTIDKIDELEEETVKYNEDQKYPEHTHCMGGFWQNMVSAANISGI